MVSRSDSIPDAWLYLAMDLRHHARTKLGMTSGDKYSRTGRQTANPGMVPLVHIAVPAGEVRQIEAYLHSRCNLPSETHGTTGNDSEWYSCSPQQLANAIKHRLSGCLGKGTTEDGGYDFSDFVEFPDSGRLLDLAWTLRKIEFGAYRASGFSGGQKPLK